MSLICRRRQADLCKTRPGEIFASMGRKAFVRFGFRRRLTYEQIDEGVPAPHEQGRRVRRFSEKTVFIVWVSSVLRNNSKRQRKRRRKTILDSQDSNQMDDNSPWNTYSSTISYRIEHMKLVSSRIMGWSPRNRRLVDMLADMFRGVEFCRRNRLKAMMLTDRNICLKFFIATPSS